MLRRRSLTVACLLVLAFAAGGCSLSYQLDARDDGSADETGSVPAAPSPTENDLAIARAAMNECSSKVASTPACVGRIPRAGHRALSRHFNRPTSRVASRAVTFS